MGLNWIKINWCVHQTTLTYILISLKSSYRCFPFKLILPVFQSRQKKIKKYTSEKLRHLLSKLNPFLKKMNKNHHNLQVQRYKVSRFWLKAYHADAGWFISLSFKFPCSVTYKCWGIAVHTPMEAISRFWFKLTSRKRSPKLQVF